MTDELREHNYTAKEELRQVFKRVGCYGLLTLLAQIVREEAGGDPVRVKMSEGVAKSIERARDGT